jgi:SnoaL-like protein
MERSSRARAVVRRLDRLEAERAILRTLYRYGHAIDLGLDAEWVDCFTEDGEYDVLYGSFEPTRIELGARHQRGVLHRGRRQLAAFVGGHSRPPGGIHKHLLFEPRITVRGGIATAVSYYVRIDLVDGAPHTQSFGRYRDRLRRLPGGEWRFTRREVHIDGVRPRR